jgi:hypothetical protein
MAESFSDIDRRFSALVQSLPAIRGAPGACPWDAVALNDWAASGVPSHGELCTARFVLAVWDPSAEWRSGRFDVMDALGVWDIAHRSAFLKWAADPWWA